MATRRLHTSTRAVDQNIRAVKQWEKAALRDRSYAERFADWITRAAATGPVVIGHLLWFTLWIVVNLGLVPGVKAFDPFPFSLLTMVVSLEAIFLSLFVLASQNRLSTQSDKRAHLDLQVDLLAEREMTAVLLLLHDIGKQLRIETSVSRDQIDDLGTRIDIYGIAGKLDALADKPSKVQTR